MVARLKKNISFYLEHEKIKTGNINYTVGRLIIPSNEPEKIVNILKTTPKDVLKTVSSLNENTLKTISSLPASTLYIINSANPDSIQTIANLNKETINVILTICVIEDNLQELYVIRILVIYLMYITQIIVIKKIWT
jgi:hypothetical protein